MKRNFGLDIYRSIAILMVMTCHSLGIFYRTFFDTDPIAFALGLGVEVFFALSGFLIGGILLREVVEQPQPVSAPRKLFAFYLRRWMRTLPLYYLLVFVSFLYPLLPPLSMKPGPVSRSTLLANLLFLQNYRATWLNVQPVSWSLSVEEWFYLLVAIGMLVISFAATRHMRARLVLAFALAVILGSFIYRGSDALINHTGWILDQRKQIFMHMDALMYGVLAAWVRFYYRDLYTRFARSNVFAAVATVLVVVLAYRCVYVPMLTPNASDSLLVPTVGITLMGAGFAALVMVFQERFAGIQSVPRWLVAIGEHISTRSYGYYLIHWPTFIIIEAGLQRFANGSTTLSAPAQGMANIVALGLTFLIAGIVYVWFELPIMRLRDHIQLIPIHAGPVHASPVRFPATPVRSQLRPASVSAADARGSLDSDELAEWMQLPETRPMRRVR